MKDVLLFGVGEFDFVILWNICEMGIYFIEEGYIYYILNFGFLELRKEISRYLKERFDLDYLNYREQILVIVGVSEVIDIVLRSIVNFGDEVLIFEFCFVLYKLCVIFVGGVLVEIEIRLENDFKFRVEDILFKIFFKIKVIILFYFNNLIGVIMIREDLKEIVDILKDRDIIVIFDEIYVEFIYEGSYVLIVNFFEMKEKIIVINGFLKVFVMIGWRFGFVVVEEVFIKVMVKVYQYIIMSVLIFFQYVVIEVFKNGFLEVEKMREEYNRRRCYMVNRFNKMGFECFELKGVFYVFLFIKVIGFFFEEFVERFLYEQKVVVVLGIVFGRLGEGFIRCLYVYLIEIIK